MIFITCVLILLCSIPGSQCFINTSTTFLGTGYNIVHGNPEGVSISKDGGLDPGLRATMQILKTTFSHGDFCPQEATCVRLESSSDIQRTDFVDDLVKYRNEYQRSLTLETSSQFYSLTASLIAKGTQEEIKHMVEANQDVLITEETTKILAEASYRYATHKYLDEEFTSQLCDVYETFQYHRFFDIWGTHVIVQTRLGTKRFVRKVYTKTEFMRHVQNQYSNLAQVEMKEGISQLSVSSQATSGRSSDIARSLSATKSHYAVYVTGSSTAPVPVTLELIDIPSFIRPEYFESHNACPNVSVQQLQSVLRSQMEKYIRSYETKLEYNKRYVKVAWPSGQYSLPKAVQGCPEHWESGSRRHDTEDYHTSNFWSSGLGSMLDSVLQENYIIWYCTKKDTLSFPDIFVWMPGSYCIFRRGGSCPTGFSSGEIYIDDEDSANKNYRTGTLPDGEYGRNTLYETCCRNDGSTSNPIILPTSTPFFLLPVYDKCQTVKGMTAREHFIGFDCEDDRPETSVTGRIQPRTHMDNRKNLKLYLCYYSTG